MPLPEGVQNGIGNQPGSDNATPPTPANDPQNALQAPAFQIDPRFANLPQGEAIARTVQSMVTPLYQQVNEYKGKLEKYETYLEAIADITENEEAKMAFIREIAPELVKPADIDEQVKAAPDKKYGRDFKPDRTVANEDYWSADAKYIRDTERFLKEFEEKSKGQTNKTYSELKKEVTAKKLAQREAERKEIEDLQREFNLPEEELLTFKQWAKSAKLRDHFLHYRAIRNTGHQSSLSSVQSGNNYSPNEKLSMVENLFGPSRTR